MKPNQKDYGIVRGTSLIIIEAAKAGKDKICISLNQPPVIKTDDDFTHDKSNTKKIINRLKVMAGLAPMNYNAPKQEIIRLTIEGIPYNLHCTFIDSAEDPSCEINIEKVKN